MGAPTLGTRRWARELSKPAAGPFLVITGVTLGVEIFFAAGLWFVFAAEVCAGSLVPGLITAVTAMISSVPLVSRKVAYGYTSLSFGSIWSNNYFAVMHLEQVCN
jgi:hypothetical protein